ncbi:3-dehydroquinate synthase AroB [Butyrivibrio proteoclasticus B316]|uniref:3-dehydroquinate synthase n=1 Tax=Butyrivibrio proteoclasticus (strain ATCC 51982 / DSM 14932 / B316) TaxID=515622 RepID=E0RWB5_BUTPB|nr:3-dehydroquinate synthase [Butyrivibrio proteoclasticus]ADL34213.1 3-dehydroquinate synthase AroB [Butyrivibrio proteoclasticus B316]
MSGLLTINYDKKPCYNIVFDTSFDGLSDSVAELGFNGRKIAVITDSNVKPLYGDEVVSILKSVSDKVFIYEIPAGENNKNLSEINKIYSFLIKNHFDRHDLLVALGGGVVGDMTGFTAATYLRGISFIQIPTTLLAQTDSSIGGKTGVDFDGYKNMIGAFHMPSLVYTNISTLNTLSDRQFASGFAEVMKHGLIKDQNFYTWLIENMYEISDKDQDVTLEMIRRSCEIKKAVVEKDPTEKGGRALLNFGHTIGHAIEKAKNFELLHGECVALGCVAAAFMSWKKELISMEEYYEIRDMFVPFNLPISIEDIDPEEVIRLTKSDKKSDSNKIRFILLKGIGKAFITTDITDEDMKKALDEIIYIENND